MLAKHTPQLRWHSEGRDVPSRRQRTTLQEQRQDARNDVDDFERVHGWRNELLLLTVWIAKRIGLAECLAHCTYWPLRNKRRRLRIRLAIRKAEWDLAECTTQPVMSELGLRRSQRSEWLLELMGHRNSFMSTEFGWRLTRQENLVW
jgi:hypothetical protein